MGKTWLIIRREYLERIRSRAFVIMTLLMPVFMASTILLPERLAMMKTDTTHHVVIVASNTELADAIKQRLLAAPHDLDSEDSTPEAPSAKKQRAPEVPRYSVTIDSNVSDAERDALRTQVSDKKIDGFVWLSDDAIARRRISYSARDVTDFRVTAELRHAVTTALFKAQLAGKGIDDQQVEQLLKPIRIDSVHIDKGKEGASGASVFTTSFVLIMLLYANVLVYGFAVMRSIIEEKSSRILEVLLSSVTAKELLAGKIIGVGAVGLTQILIWLVMGLVISFPGIIAAQSYVSGVHLPMIGIIAFGVFFLLGYFLYATMYAGLGAMVNSDQEAQHVQWPAMLPIILSIVLSMPVLEHPNSQLAIWLSMIPFFAPILMFVRVMVEQPPVWQLILCVSLILATAYGVLLLSSRIYRVGILMYGKRPTLPELRRWLKYAG